MRGGGKTRTSLEELLLQDDIDIMELQMAIGYALISLDRKVDNMAVDQATFDAALTAFTDDLNAGMAAIQAKLASAAPAVDLSAELQQINDAKAAFDTAVTADTTPAPAPAPADTTGGAAATDTSGATTTDASGATTTTEPPNPADTVTP